MWYPPFLEAVLNKHQETVDTAFIHYRTLFQFEKLAAEPIVLLLSLELLDRLLTFKNKDQASREKFPVSTELLILIVFYYTAKYSIDNLKLFTSAPLIRAGLIALQAQPDIHLSLNPDNIVEFLKNLTTEQAIDARAISLLLAHLFRLEVLMEPVDELAAMQTLTTKVLTHFGRDDELFETLAQELRDEKYLYLMHYDVIIANIFVMTMLENGCFNGTDRPYVAAIFPELNAALFPIFKQVSEQAYTDISTLSSMDGLRSALEHKRLEQRYSAYYLMKNDLNEQQSDLIDVYYATPALLGSLEIIFKVLLQKGVFDLYEFVDDEASNDYVFNYIYDYIEGNGKFSIDDTIRKIMRAARYYFMNNTPALSRMIDSPLIPNFPYYRDILVNALLQAYDDLLKAADIDDVGSVDEMRGVLGALTNAQLYTFSHLVKIIYQYNRGLEYQLFELVAKHVEALDVYYVLIKMLDQCELLSGISASDLSAVEVGSNVCALAEGIVYELLASECCEVGDRGIVAFAAAFGVDLGKVTQAVCSQLHYPKLGNLTAFSFTMEPISTSSSGEELRLSR